MAHEIKDLAEFKAKLAEAGSKLVVVDFFATWYGHCFCSIYIRLISNVSLPKI